MTAKQLFKQIEQDIIDNNPTKKERERSGLKKYIGKAKTFTGTYSFQDERGSVIIRDIKLKGSNKILAHHMWIPYDKSYCFDIWDTLEIEAIVRTYNSKGGQKYRLDVIGKAERV